MCIALRLLSTPLDEPPLEWPFFCGISLLVDRQIPRYRKRQKPRYRKRQKPRYRIKRVEKRLEEFAKSNSTCERLQTIPGVGLITSTAIVASVSNPKQFKNGRHFAAWAGLVPRHSGTGGAHNNRVGNISKKGDPYLRQLLVHGSRSVIIHVEKREDAGAAWIKRIRDKGGWNKAAVALANKNARIIWAVLNTETTFDIKKMAKAV